MDRIPSSPIEDLLKRAGDQRREITKSLKNPRALQVLQDTREILPPVWYTDLHKNYVQSVVGECFERDDIAAAESASIDDGKDEDKSCETVSPKWVPIVRREDVSNEESELLAYIRGTDKENVVPSVTDTLESTYESTSSAQKKRNFQTQETESLLRKQAVHPYVEKRPIKSRTLERNFLKQRNLKDSDDSKGRTVVEDIREQSGSQVAAEQEGTWHEILLNNQKYVKGRTEEASRALPQRFLIADVPSTSNVGAISLIERNAKDNLAKKIIPELKVQKGVQVSIRGCDQNERCDNVKYCEYKHDSSESLVNRDIPQISSNSGTSSVSESCEVTPTSDRFRSSSLSGSSTSDEEISTTSVQNSKRSIGSQTCEVENVCCAKTKETYRKRLVAFKDCMLEFFDGVIDIYRPTHESSEETTDNELNDSFRAESVNLDTKESRMNDGCIAGARFVQNDHKKVGDLLLPKTGNEDHKRHRDALPSTSDRKAYVHISQERDREASNCALSDLEKSDDLPKTDINPVDDCIDVQPKIPKKVSAIKRSCSHKSMRSNPKVSKTIEQSPIRSLEHGRLASSKLHPEVDKMCSFRNSSNLDTQTSMKSIPSGSSITTAISLTDSEDDQNADSLQSLSLSKEHTSNDVTDSRLSISAASIKNTSSASSTDTKKEYMWESSSSTAIFEYDQNGDSLQSLSLSNERTSNDVTDSCLSISATSKKKCISESSSTSTVIFEDLPAVSLLSSDESSSDGDQP